MGSVFQIRVAVFFGSPAIQYANGNSSQFQLRSQAAAGHPPAAEQKVIRDAGANATIEAFVSILPLLGLAKLACALLGNVCIAPPQKDVTGGHQHQEDVGGTTAVAIVAAAAIESQTRKEDGKHGRDNKVLDSIYLLALVKSKVEQQKQVKWQIRLESRQADSTALRPLDKSDRSVV